MPAVTATFLTLATAAAITLSTAFTGEHALAASKDVKTPQSPISAQTNAASNTQNSKEFGMGTFLKDYSTAISIIVSLIGGIITYSVNESWKRRQYVEEKVKDFEEKMEVINVRKILSTELQCVELFPFESEPKHRYVIVKDCLWADALLECKCNIELEKEYRSIDKKRPLYEQEAAVKAVTRDNFNRFLDYLQQFEKMIESKVVKKKDLENYLALWFDLISGVNGREIVICSISNKGYVPKKALLEYMGLLEDIPESDLSVVQKDVRALVTRYRTLASLMEDEKAVEQSFSSPSPVSSARC
ncbi:MAG: hypothetical protein HC866_26160 [Leptolyngbyaceae cyanobacterium RU_5_1]|nr:hypothetical protein [Leptolyngbyaceae cyanobacterium RU_5_1]